MVRNSFTVPIPDKDKSPSLIADYIELNAIASFDKTVSAIDVGRQMNRDEDEDEDKGVSDDVPDYVTAAFNEIARRIELCAENNYYPFSLSSEGDLITYVPESKSWLYVFCLLATRANMQVNRFAQVKKRRVDATKLFEQVTPCVLKKHLNISSYMIIGTSRVRTSGTGLKGAVEGFLLHYGEAGKFENRWNHGGAGDGGCDVIAWMTQPDNRHGKATIFCSCKTGDSWKDNSDYKPDPQVWSDSFASSRAFAVAPVPCLVVAEALSIRDYSQKIEKHRLLSYDRTRISLAEPLVPWALKVKCCCWAFSAAKSVFGIDLELA